ncbi:DUF2381 family protein [Hyalangium versicolor]|uniref:DUF2381 family protein n=1 Tax=Hyalangium versicolor TaxID=2861190 RepID=UPI001CCB8F40|nr:DUF2381 family protein [Hyalangium versicolor]
MTWSRVALGFLVASTAAAQPQLPARQRQDRRAVLPTTPAEPVLEVYVAAGNLTTVAFNGPLDRDSLTVDRTRFKWLDVGDNTLALEPIVDLSPSERLILQVGFKDKALPTKAVLAVLTKMDVTDGKVEVDRRANTPEALLAALMQKNVELEELKARCTEPGPAGLVFSGWLKTDTRGMNLKVSAPSLGSMGLEAIDANAYQGNPSTLVAIQLKNPPGQKLWAPGTVRLTGLPGAPVRGRAGIKFQFAGARDRAHQCRHGPGGSHRGEVPSA